MSKKTEETYVFLWRIRHKLGDVDYMEQVDQEIQNLSRLLFNKGISFSLITADYAGYGLITAPKEEWPKIQDVATEWKE